MGVTDFVSKRTCPEEHLNLSKLGFVSEEGHSGCNSQHIAIRALKGNVLCQIWFKWTYEANWSTGEVPQRTSGRIPCPVGKNLEIFLTSHMFLFIFGQCGDNCK